MRPANAIASALLLAGGCVLFLPTCSRTRVQYRRFHCGANVKQIVLAQLNFQSMRARGQQDFLGDALDQSGKPVRETDGTVRSDNSKAFVALSRLGLIDTLAAFACPQDPFIAVLSTTGRSLPADLDDFPIEGAPTAEPWTGPDALAATETGHTYYSYSMQTRGPLAAASFSPKMDPRIPIVSDRNPYSVAQSLNLDQTPTDRSEAGNPWSHDRRGQSMAFMDARVEFLDDARMLPLRLDPAAEFGATGFDYLYADNSVTPDKPSDPRNGSCPPRGQTAFIAGGNPKGWAVWMTD